MGGCRRLIVLSVALATIAPLTSALAQTEPVSFAGKQVKVLVGYSPTGFGYDTYGRLLVRHMGKYLPGNPSLLPQNRPGAGSLNLANYLYYAAVKPALAQLLTKFFASALKLFKSIAGIGFAYIACHFSWRQKKIENPLFSVKLGFIGYLFYLLFAHQFY